MNISQKKHETVTDNPAIIIYLNKIENRINFKIKTGYYLELLTPEMMKLLGSTNHINHINIKQHSQVIYLGCVLDERMSCEPMALKVINKINGKLKFLYRKNRHLIKELRRMLCNALIQPHFDYECPARYP